MKNILTATVCLLLACVPCFAQSSYKGLTPGRSTRADVERVLGRPTSQVSERLFEYTKDGKQIYVQYSKGSPTAVRVQLVYSTPRERAQVISDERLPKVADTRRINKHAVLEEYFSYPKYVVLTYEENSQTRVSQVGYYSRELFEAATPELTASTPSSPRTSGASASDSAAVISGAWHIEQKGGGRTYTGTLNLTQDGFGFKGTAVWDNHQNGSIKGALLDVRGVAFTIYYSDSLEGHYEATLSENGTDMIDGTARDNKGGPTVSWSARRVSQ
jgi:hypothetical protein